MERGNSEMPCKIRKRRFPTTSSSSFANNNLSQLLVETTPSHSLRNEKCINRLGRSTCKEEESATVTLQKPGVDHQVETCITNVDRSRNKSRTYPDLVSAPEIRNGHHRHSSSFLGKEKASGGMHSLYDAKQFEDKSQPPGQVEIETNHHKRPTPKPSYSLNEIDHSLTMSKELLKLLTHIWTTDLNHSHHPTTTSLVSTLNHELNKARSHVNKLIQEQGSNNTVACKSKDQDKAVKTVARELEVERKLRRQTERINKKLGQELANTKSFLSEAIRKAESEKQATKILEQLCEEMAQGIEEDRVKLEELHKESERVREEMEEEREMFRITDMLREERVYMKLLDAKYEYENKHAQVDTLIYDLREAMEADNNGAFIMDHSNRILNGLLWDKNRGNEEGKVVIDENAILQDSTGLLSCQDKENDYGFVVNDENFLKKETTGLLWSENKRNYEGEAIIDENMTRKEIVSMHHDDNSDCIEWEFGLDKDLKGCLAEKVLGVSCLSEIKEYEDEMERYKMIKDLRDHIVSGSGLTISKGFVTLQEATQGH